MTEEDKIIEEKLLEKASAKTTEDSLDEDSLELEKQVIERLAAIEHEQWIKWSQDIASKESLSEARLKRWKSLWIPYSELSDEMKEHDRKWAKEALKVLNNGYSIIYNFALQKGKENERIKLEGLKSDLIGCFKGIRKNDKTIYTYDGEDSKTRDGDIPKKGERWITPKEFAENWIKELESGNLTHTQIQDLDKVVTKQASKIADLEKEIASLEEGLIVQKHFESVKDKRIAELEKELETIGESLNQANEGRIKQGKYAVEMFGEVKRLQLENRKMKEERKQLTDDFQFLIDDCVSCTCKIEDWGTDLKQHEFTCDMVRFNKLLARLRGEE